MIQSMGPHVDILDRTARHEQTAFVFEVFAGPGYALGDLLCKKPILGILEALQKWIRGKFV